MGDRYSIEPREVDMIGLGKATVWDVLCYGKRIACHQREAKARELAAMLQQAFDDGYEIGHEAARMEEGLP